MEESIKNDEQTLQRAHSGRPPRGVLISIVGVLAVLSNTTVMGALPTPAPPSRGPGTTGNYIELLQNYAYDIFLFLGLAMATIAFFAVARNVIGAYSEVQEGKGSWGQVVVQFGVGVLLLMFVVFILTEAGKVL